MWRYKNTDELYYYGVNKNNDTLFHSDHYLGADYSDGIKHYKYIRKYNKNGRTYYVYDNIEEKYNDFKAKNALDLANKIGSRGYTNSEGNYIIDKTDKYGVTSTTYLGRKKQTSIDKVKEKTHNRAIDIYLKHRVQQIKDIPKKIFAKGLSAVSSILKKLRND